MELDEQVQAFWSDFCARTGTPPEALTAVAAFGDSPAMNDELLELVLAGTKRATAGLVSEFERDGTPLPQPGDLWIALDGSGAPRCVLRTTEARTGPLSSVDDAFAYDEGEGDRTREDWLSGHRAYWHRQGERLGRPFDESAETVVFERFDVVEPRRARDGGEG